MIVMLPWPEAAQSRRASSLPGSARRNIMEHSDLHLKENEELLSCFSCLGRSTGAFRDEATANVK